MFASGGVNMVNVCTDLDSQILNRVDNYGNLSF